MVLHLLVAMELHDNEIDFLHENYQSVSVVLFLDPKYRVPNRRPIILLDQI